MILSRLITTTSPLSSFQQSSEMVALLSCICSPKLMAFRNMFVRGGILKCIVDVMEISKYLQCSSPLHRIQPWTLPEVVKEKKHLSHESNRLHKVTLFSELPHTLFFCNTLFHKNNAGDMF